MKMHLRAPAIVTAFVLGLALGRLVWGLPSVSAAGTTPTGGWNIHVDAEKHFGANPSEIAHHWCKPVSGGLFECQIYNSDAPDARLVAVETIVTPATYRSFSPAEQQLWHYHKVEIPKVNATMPDMTAQQSAKMIASMLDTYGKVWLLWDPVASSDPIGMPTITILK